MLGACEAAGFRFIRGQGVQKDIKRGKALVDRACNDGYIRACVAMGLGYDGDLFGKPGPEAAASYTKKLAMLNLSGAVAYWVTSR